MRCASPRGLNLVICLLYKFLVQRVHFLFAEQQEKDDSFPANTTKFLHLISLGYCRQENNYRGLFA